MGMNCDLIEQNKKTKNSIKHYEFELGSLLRLQLILIVSNLISLFVVSIEFILIAICCENAKRIAMIACCWP